MGRKKNGYWGEREEKLVGEYIVNQTESNYHELRPSLLTLYRGVLYRYFRDQFDEEESGELIHDCETNLIERKTIQKFRIGNAKAYSFIGTCAKNYFVEDVFTKRKKIEQRFEVLDQNENGDWNYDLADQSTESFSREEAISRIKQFLELKNLYPQKRIVLTTLIELLKDYPVDLVSKHYTTYYLLKNTGFDSRIVARYLNTLNIMGLIFVKYRLAFYKKLFIENKVEENNIMEFLHAYENNVNGKKYIIQNKAERKAKRNVESVH